MNIKSPCFLLLQSQTRYFFSVRSNKHLGQLAIQRLNIRQNATLNHAIDWFSYEAMSRHWAGWKIQGRVRDLCNERQNIISILTTNSSSSDNDLSQIWHHIYRTSSAYANTLIYLNINEALGRYWNILRGFLFQKMSENYEVFYFMNYHFMTLKGILKIFCA